MINQLFKKTISKTAVVLSVLSMFFLLTPTITHAEEKKSEPQVTVSNIGSESFSISWFTDTKVDGSILYGKTEAGLVDTTFDDRGKDTPRLTHHVTLKNLQPSTDYYFKIADTTRVYRQKTAATIPTTVIPPTPERFRGTIVTEDKLVPAEAIIYFKMSGASLITSVMNSDGTYEVLTTNMRTDALNSYYKVEELKYADFFIRTGFEGEAIRKVFAAVRRDPIDFTLLAPRIPFYKIVFPGFIEPAQPASTSTPGTASNAAPTGNTQGFFGTVWETIKSLF